MSKKAEGEKSEGEVKEGDGVEDNGEQWRETLCKVLIVVSD